jgi:hypothetical protein
VEEWPVGLQSVGIEVVAREARDLMLALARLRIKAAAEKRAPLPAFWVRDITYRSVLLPVWVAQMEGRSEPLLGLVNGQTGKVTFGLSGGKEAHSPKASAQQER